MAKRLIDTELWNNEDIIEYFTAEDKYFWLYLLTNPHNNICGVMKASPALIARDMGYSKECIQNLMYRFENVHKAIFVDKETHELLILNWGKFNWNKSPDILRTVEKNLASINSEMIKTIIDRKIAEIWEFEHPVNTLSTPCQQGTITITNTITIYKEEFEDIWSIYPNKKGKDKALKHYIKARKDGVEMQTIRQGVQNYADYCKSYATDKQFISHGDTWFGNRRWTDEYEMKSSATAPQRSVTTEKDQSDLDEIFGKVMANGRKGNS